ncbi:MAG TPA: hypothetical protein VJ749_11365 [Pyrinomonadaceae bacterium]|jgi:hypothetical protein|nr:hypothetical protein [Pyrinomonadaceae bacterium]
MNNKLKPALLGGLIVGVLSALPFISTCCCIWAIGGGLVAGMLYIKSSPTQVLPGDGAIVGALSGIVGAVIYLLLGLPIAFLRGTADVESQLARSGVHLPFTGTVLLLVGGLVGALSLLVLATLGGILAVPIFEKRKAGGPPAPPPPTNAGGPGTYAA